MDGPILLLALLLVAVGYACGSVPVGVLVAKVTGGPDPRTIGSGRTGATNALRALGPRGAGLVVAGDLLKGAVAVGVARLASGGNPSLEVLCAAAAVVGSARSMFLGFGGGRGVVTVAGTMLLIAPLTLLVAGPVFVLTVAVSRYVSLGSLLGSASMFPATLLLVGGAPLAYMLYSFVAPAIVWIAHADNIDRLIHGTERKFDFGLLTGRGAGPE